MQTTEKNGFGNFTFNRYKSDRSQYEIRHDCLDAGCFPPNDLWNHLAFESGFAHLTSGQTEDTANTCNRSPTAKRKFNDITRKPLRCCSHKETGVLFLLYCD